MDGNDRITIKAAIKILEVTLRKDCVNETADELTEIAITMLESVSSKT